MDRKVEGSFQVPSYLSRMADQSQSMIYEIKISFHHLSQAASIRQIKEAELPFQGSDAQFLDWVPNLHIAGFSKESLRGEKPGALVNSTKEGGISKDLEGASTIRTADTPSLSPSLTPSSIWAIEDKQELIDIVETVYRGASKGRGLVVSPKG